MTISFTDSPVVVALDGRAFLRVIWITPSSPGLRVDGVTLYDSTESGAKTNPLKINNDNNSTNNVLPIDSVPNISTFRVIFSPH